MSSTVTKPTLTYFPFLGRSVAPRLSLHAAFGEGGWEFVQMSFDEFGKQKELWTNGDVNTKLASGSLPQLELTDGRVITQSHAMARWACQKANQLGKKSLYPSDPDESIEVDEMVAFADELMMITPQHEDTEMKKQLRKKFAETRLKAGCEFMERKLKGKDGPFLMGNDMTLADIYIWSVTECLESGNFDFVEPSYLDDYDALKAQMKAVWESSWFQEYNGLSYEPKLK